MRIKQTPDRLLLRDSIGFIVWAMGLILIVSGVWQFVHFLSVWGKNEVSGVALAASAALGLAFVTIGVFCLVNFPATSVVLDRASRIVTIRSASLRMVETSRFSFDEIDGFALVETDDNDGGQLWRVEMTTKTGERIPLSNGYTGNREMWQSVQTRASEFLRK